MKATLPSSSAVVIPFRPQPGDFFTLRKSLVLGSTVWQSMDAIEQALYVNMAARYDGFNNGRIPYSVRDAKAALHRSQDIVYRALRGLEERGLIVCRQPGLFNQRDKESQKPLWELPEYVPTTGTFGTSPICATGTFNGGNVPTAGTIIESLDKKDSDSEGSEASGLPRQKGQKASQPSATPSPSPSSTPCQDVPRAAAPGEVPPADGVLIEYDTPAADLAARYMGRALGKPFPRYGRTRGFYLSTSELDAIKALAAAEGAAS